ncbi:MAG: hypothetical protein JO320_14625 [Alphaproteobacteria bacterium]|nr:hypothetical protein [Alphaproteobacteria bacterium]MBV9376268.1 hypothetical protein [Alphaproteobacteria bacterium]
MIALSITTIPQYTGAGTVVGALAVYQNGVAISGATFLIEDDQSDFTISGGNLAVGGALSVPGYYNVKVDAVASGVIIDTAEFTINVVAVSPDGTTITGGKGSVLSPQGSWTFGTQSTATPGNWAILLNGVATGNTGSVIEIAHGGNVYYKGISGTWYQFVPNYVTGVWIKGSAP